jgi:hypothetical protein
MLAQADLIEFPCAALIDFTNKVVYNHGTIIKIKKLTLTQYY